jgi:hypothetical protein
MKSLHGKQIKKAPIYTTHYTHTHTHTNTHTHTHTHTHTQGIVFPFAAESEEDMEAWLRAIGKGIVNATTTGFVFNKLGFVFNKMGFIYYFISLIANATTKGLFVFC